MHGDGCESREKGFKKRWFINSEILADQLSNAPHKISGKMENAKDN